MPVTVMPFFEQFFSQCYSAIDMKKLLTVTPLQESKQGSTRSGLANLFEGMCKNVHAVSKKFLHLYMGILMKK